MHEAVAAIAAEGVSPIVRIAANEGWMVKRMFLDLIPSLLVLVLADFKQELWTQELTELSFRFFTQLTMLGD